MEILIIAGGLLDQHIILECLFHSENDFLINYFADCNNFNANSPPPRSCSVFCMLQVRKLSDTETLSDFYKVYYSAEEHYSYSQFRHLLSHNYIVNNLPETSRYL